MKVKLLTLFLLGPAIGSGQFVANTPRLDVEVASALPGSSVTLNVLLDAAGRQVSSLQFDLRYESEGMTVRIVESPAARAAGKRAWTNEIGASRTRVVLAGAGAAAIPDGQVLQMTVDLNANLAAGLHPLVIEAALASDPQGAALFLTATAGGVFLSSAGTATPPVVAGLANAASYKPGAVSPGEILVIGGRGLGGDFLTVAAPGGQGEFPTTLAGTRAFFDGVPAPLIYASAQQIAVVVPYSLFWRARTALEVEYLGARAAPFPIPVLPAVPGIFTLDQSGLGQAAIVNEDGTINGIDHPAPRGSVLSVYATGEGQTAPPGTDGAAVSAVSLRRPLLPVVVFLGGIESEVLYAGSAPNQVAGLLQINARVPPAVVPGSAVPLTIRIGQNSPDGTTVAIR